MKKTKYKNYDNHKKNTVNTFMYLIFWSFHINKKKDI